MIPLTKTSFAWPLQKIIGINNQPVPQKKEESDNDKDKQKEAPSLIEAPLLSGSKSPFDTIQLIRSGRVSTFTAPSLQSLLPENDLGQEINTDTQNLNATQNNHNSQGVVNVKR
jgi:hypothetical protein